MTGTQAGRLPVFSTQPAQDGSPHVEIRGGTLDFVVTERGNELLRRQTIDADELLYWLVEIAAHHAASDWELRHRIVGEDCRKQVFAKEIELLGVVSEKWARRKRCEIDLILTQYPYKDGP